MKKLLLSLCLLTAFTLAANAQSLSDIGIRGGINFANLSNTEDNEFDSRTSFMIGAYTAIGIPNSPISIQPEVLYNRKGFKDEGNGMEGTIELDYIDIPILAKFDFMLDGPLTPYVYAGPYIGINVNAYVDIEENNGGGGGGLDIDDIVKDTVFGVVVGGGLDFGRFNAGVRYDAGLSGVYEDEVTISDAKHSVFSVTVGYDLNL